MIFPYLNALDAVLQRTWRWHSRVFTRVPRKPARVLHEARVPHDARPLPLQDNELARHRLPVGVCGLELPLELAHALLELHREEYTTDK